MEKIFISHQSRYSDFNVLICKSTFPFLHFDLAANNFVSRYEKDISRMNASTESEELLIFCSTDDITKSI